METLAINICILPSKQLAKVCKKVYKNDKSEYSSENLEYIPHITLHQKCIKQDDLEKIIEEIKAIDLQKFKINVWKFFYDILLGLEIIRNDNITRLQKEILKIANNFKNTKATKKSFLTEKYFFKDNISWLEYINKNPNLTNNLHITLWKDNQLENLKNLKYDKEFVFDTLCIWLMGNYCSVRKKLFEFKI